MITDAPIDSAGCIRLELRLGLGLARAGSIAHNDLGEILLRLANGLCPSVCGSPEIMGKDLDVYFEANVDAAEEAIIA